MFFLSLVVSVVCTWFYVDSKSLSYFTEKALQLPLTNRIMSVLPQAKRMIGNIRPTDMAAVLAPNKQGDMAVFPMIWGFTHEVASQPIVNCRIETANQKVLWRDSWFRRRCIIPASWYFEWGIPPSEVDFHNTNEHNSIKKEKYAIQPEGTEITYLAGLYRFEEHRDIQIPMFAVLTRESVAPVRAIHDRMPLILGKEDLKDWIRPDSNPASISKRALTNMVMERAGNYPDPVPAFMQVKSGIY